VANKRVEPEVLKNAAEYVRGLMRRSNVKQVAAGQRWGISQSTVSDVVSGEAIGIDVAIRIVKAEGGSLDAMFGLVSDARAKPLRELPSWPSCAAAAAAFVPRAVIDEAGAFVPPRPIEDVTATGVLLLAQAWMAMRPHAEHAPADGPRPANPIAPFGVAGSRASKKRDRQAT
jgi:hypothetical protein